MKLITDFIIVTGILLNLLVLAGLIRFKVKLLPHRILLIFWSCILIIILHFYAALHGLRTFNRITFLIEDGSRFFLPPLILLYIKSIFFNRTYLIKNNIVHFLPFLVYFIGYTIPRFTNLWTDPNLFHYIEFLHRVINITLIKDLFAIAYFSWTLYKVLDYRTSMKNHYSTIKETDFSWLIKFLICFLGVVLFDFIATITEISFSYNVMWDGFITLTLLIFAMGYLGYNGLSQKRYFLPDFHLQKSTSPSPNTKEMSKNDLLLESKLVEVMKKEKLYLNSEITLRILAEHLGTSERKLSAILNNKMQTSFYDFINHYRVKEAIEYLTSKNNEKYSVQGIGELCGFKSKSTFYRVFKKETGTTPASYAIQTKM